MSTKIHACIDALGNAVRLVATAGQAGDQAEVVFGHGLNLVLGESIQVMILVSRQ